MSQRTDELLSELEDVRRELGGIEGEPSAPSRVASRVYEAIDVLALKVLRLGVTKEWDVPASDRRKAKRDMSLSSFVAVAEEHAPAGVDRQTLSKIAGELHILRNAIKYRDDAASVAKCYEYLEALLTIAYQMDSPSDIMFPAELLGDLVGFRLQGIFPLKRGLLPSRWAAFHGSRSANYGEDHRIMFFRHKNDSWERMNMVELGAWNVATVQVIETRSSHQEELLVWRRGGESMGVMSYDVYSVEGDELVRLLSREGIPGAYVYPFRHAVEEHAGGRIIRFQWDGLGYVGQRVIRQVPLRADSVPFHYDVVGGAIRAPSDVALRVGQTLEMFRGDFEPTIVRQLGSGTQVLEWSNGAFVGRAGGETHITLIPDVYSDKPFRVRVVVLADSDERMSGAPRVTDPTGVASQPPPPAA